MSKRNAIKYVENDEPSFIRQFKEKIGYKEGPDVNTKRQKRDYDSEEEEEDRSDTEEEKPTVVVLKAGDLTAEEVNEEELFMKTLEEEIAIQEGKITFKKPVKKTEEAPPEPGDEAASPDTPSSPKPEPKPKDKGKSKEEKKKKKKDKELKAAQSLLSFGDEEEEEEDG